MSVHELNLLFTGRSGKDDTEKHRTYKRVYEALTQLATDDEQVVAAVLVSAGIVLGANFPPIR
jgi:hypothetical protein